MSFLKNLFRHDEKHAESIVLIDIAADSIAGAYVHYIECETPVLLYTRRLPIEVRKDEPHECAMIRALKVLGDDLVREGAPTLMRATGSGSANTVLVSIDTPWQETNVRTEKFERANPFTLTKHMVVSAIQQTSPKVSGKLVADESIIGTILNGYETHHPYGRKVHRASVVVLTSLIDKEIAESISTTLHGLFHTKRIFPIAGSSLRYQAMRIAFPHERDALILDSTGQISISLIRRDLFIALAEVPRDNKRSWIENVMDEFATIAKKYPLPRIIFLLAREPELVSLQKKLDDGDLGKLWLSDHPPKIVPVLASHIADSVRQATTTPPDLQLLLMALYQQKRISEES
ncbi:MAG: hypothetical protein WCS97_01630 [Candidatus Paceibacterota bacterium]|jgi:hypothetical protein